MSDQQGEQVQGAEQATEAAAAEPAPFHAAGSEDDYMEYRLGQVLQRHPELSDERTATQAIQTAQHVAREAGDESLAMNPTILELAHIANLRALAEEEAARPPEVPDPIEELIKGGKNGPGSGVLAF